MLTSRLVSADLQGAHNTIIPTMGSPQGGILSPLVWNLVMNSLLSTFPEEGVKAIGYADDVILIVNGDDPSTMASLMERALWRVCEWGSHHGLTFNPEKTTTVMFHRGRKRDYSPELYMGGRKLKYSDKLTYLGITLSKRLSWTDHIKSRVRKCTYLLNKTKNLVGKEWGLNPSRALWIFEAIIRPKLTYGCLVWSHSLNQTNNNLLNRVQRLGLMGASHSLRSTPLAALEMILGVLPICLHISALAEAARFRTRPLLWDRWDGVGDKKEKGHRRSLDDRLNQHCPIQFPTDVGSSNNNWVQNDCILHPRVQIFTDASKRGNNTGFAFLASRGDVVIGEGGGALGDVSVFQAEVVAIQAALLWLISNPHKLKGTKVKLWTDSQSALQSAFSLKPSSMLVEETIQLLMSAKLICQIQLAWVRGHSGVTGNEVADGMAKENAVAVQLSSPALARTGREIKKEIKRIAECKWQQWWQTIPQCGIAKSFFVVPTTQHRKFIKWMSTKKLTTLIQAVTGHGLFAGHLSRWRESLPSTCKLCGETGETSLHLWGECPALELERTQWSSLRTGGRSKTPHRLILDFFEHEKIRGLMNMNSEWLEESDPDDPPVQSEDGEGRIPFPPPKRRRL